MECDLINKINIFGYTEDEQWGLQNYEEIVSK